MFFLLPVVAGVIATTTTTTIAASTAAAVGLGVATKKIVDSVEEENNRKIARAHESARREIEAVKENAYRRKCQKRKNTQNQLAAEIRSSDLPNSEKQQLINRMHNPTNLPKRR